MGGCGNTSIRVGSFATRKTHRISTANCSLTSLSRHLQRSPVQGCRVSLRPNRPWNGVLRASEILAKGNWDIGTLDRAGIELPRPANPLRRILDHFFPLRDPTDGAREGEQHREHGGREAHRLEDDARIEVDVRVELLLEEVFVVQRDALEFDARPASSGSSRWPSSSSTSSAGLLHDLRARDRSSCRRGARSP